MNREATSTVVVAGLVAGLIATVLTAATQTGAGGAYGFMLLSLLGMAIYLLWPDIRARFSRRGR